MIHSTVCFNLHLQGVALSPGASMTTPSGCVSAVLEGCLKQTLISRLDVFWVQKRRLRLVWKCLKGRKLLKLPKNCEVVPRCSVLSPSFVPGEAGVWLFGGDDLCATGSTCPCHCGFSVQDGKASILMASPGQWLVYAMLRVLGFPMVSPRFPQGFPRFPHGFPKGFHRVSMADHGRSWLPGAILLALALGHLSLSFCGLSSQWLRCSWEMSGKFLV